MLRDQKVKVVEELKQAVTSHDAVIFAEIHGMNVASMNAVRSQIRRVGGSLKIYKRRLALRGFTELGIEGTEDKLAGSTGYCFLGKDICAGARVLVDFRKVAPYFVMKGGIVQGKVLDAQAVDRLAKLPPAEVLRAQVVGGLAAPLYGFVYVLSGLLRGFVTVLDGHRRALCDKAE